VGQGLLIIKGTRSHTRRTTVGRTPLDEWSARRRDLYLTIHNIHKRQTSMPPTVFEPAIPASERSQTDALDRGAAGIITSYRWGDSLQHLQVRIQKLLKPEYMAILRTNSLKVNA